jgi:NAD+ kinase
VSERRFQRIGLVFHPQRPHARGLAEAVAEVLRETGREPVLISSEELRDGALVSGWDLALTFGGDGLLLHVARYAAPAGVPLLGINLGRVGFLTEIEPEEWAEQLQKVWEGRYWIERRLMLTAYQIREGQRAGPTPPSTTWWSAAWAWDGWCASARRSMGATSPPTSATG